MSSRFLRKHIRHLSHVILFLLNLHIYARFPFRFFMLSLSNIPAIVQFFGAFPVELSIEALKITLGNFLSLLSDGRKFFSCHLFVYPYITFSGYRFASLCHLSTISIDSKSPNVEYIRTIFLDFGMSGSSWDSSILLLYAKLSLTLGYCL